MHTSYGIVFQRWDLECFVEIAELKVPGPNAYTSAFLKKGWHLISSDTAMAVIEFFRMGRCEKL